MRKRNTKEAIRETFTGQRMALVGWGCSAIFAACLGVAAISFTNPFAQQSQQFAGAKLPQAGPVTSTGSISRRAVANSFEIFEQGQDGTPSTAQRLSDGQMDTLFKELVALRRRISMISAQNAKYSQRIATLEGTISAMQASESATQRLPGAGPSAAQRQVAAVAKPQAETPKTSVSGSTPKITASAKPAVRKIPTPSRSAESKGIVARPAKPVTASKSASTKLNAPKVAATDKVKTGAKKPSAAKKITAAKARQPVILPIEPPVPAASPFLDSLKQQAAKIDAEKVTPSVSVGLKPDTATPQGTNSLAPLGVEALQSAPAPREPIEVMPAPETLSLGPETPRISGEVKTSVDLTRPASPVREVRLIPPPSGDEAIETASIPKAEDLDTDAPIDPALASGVIKPSTPSGQTKSKGIASLGRSDFGVVIGTYENASAAAKAWKGFETANAERMKDLKPLILQVDKDGTDHFNLLAGPFANAASAAAACISLVELSPKCRPAIFTGLALPEDMRQSASN